MPDAPYAVLAKDTSGEVYCAHCWEMCGTLEELEIERAYTDADDIADAYEGNQPYCVLCGAVL